MDAEKTVPAVQRSPAAIVGKGARTRDRLMEIAEQSILEKGFGATSIDELIAEAGLTKSGFFYHFKDKNALALALLERHIARDDEILDDLFARARELAEDPLQGFLVGLRLFAEMLADLPTGHPGCIVATYCYQERLFDRQVCALNRQAVLNWRARFRTTLGEIARLYPPRDEIDLDALADAVSTVIEGGIVMSKALHEPGVLPQQVLLFRSYIKLLFSPAPQG
ncbi:MAG: TetR family transcriptional regulator [Alphaproteobacteria bacterium]|nr:TetR family transcriptional regulator [Alphaproteobacteria bacterium]